MMKDLRPSKVESLEVPKVMETLFPARVEGKAFPKSTENTKKEWFQISDENGSAAQATANDMAFFFKCQDEGDVKESWTSFNQNLGEISSEITSIGYMPIIQAPAHDLGTLNKVVLRRKHIVRELGQNHVVITVDEALYCKLMELKWANADYMDNLIVSLGGLYTAMKFMAVIGKRIQSSGLLEAWVESNLLVPNTAEQVMIGKSYNKGIRAHKITLQSMWRMLSPELLSFLGDRNPDLKEQLEKTKTGPAEDLVTFLASKEFEATTENLLFSQ